MRHPSIMGVIGNSFSTSIGIEIRINEIALNALQI